MEVCLSFRESRRGAARGLLGFTELQRARRSLFRVPRRQEPQAFYRLIAWSALERDGAHAIRNVCSESQRTQAPAGRQQVFHAVLGVP